MINNKHNAYKPSKPPADKITYSKEEYFYFGYALASLMDNRNIFQIYLDLLNQCQINPNLFKKNESRIGPSSR